MLAICGAIPAYALEPPDVLILVNRDIPVSSAVAKMYQQLRQIPPDNVLRLHLGENRSISHSQYDAQIATPLKQYLNEHSSIQCVLTTAGVPYVIQATAGTQDGAAVDNEIAAVLRDPPKDWNLSQANPLFLLGLANPRTVHMVYVARLDGPDLKTITRMVDDAIATEAAGFSGPVFGDARGLDGNTGYAAADASIRGAIDRLAGAGFPAVLDMNEADWRPPAGEIGTQAAGAAFYVGWYSLQKFQDIFGAQGLARGAIAWHIASGEAVDIWNPKGTEWCVNLLRRGAAVTIGPAFEPYVQAFPRAEILVERLLSGATVAESYWASLPHVSWAMVLLGDPLYRPFAAKPKPALVARAYVGGAGSRVMESGKTGPLLMQVQCVGPQGSATPALTASVEPESGLSGASGMVTIPPLQAGQVTVLRIPSITTGKDPTGMFRLGLKVQNPGENERRIVLEGRTGLSEISGLMDRQTEMFVSPRGLFVISGDGGRTILTNTSTLQPQRVAVPEGWGVAGVAFSPDESHVVVTLMQVEQKRVGFLLGDSGLGEMRPLPENSQFVRWLSDETILLRKAAGLFRFDIVSGTALPVFDPPGWKVNTIVPGTAIQLLVGTDGRVGVRNGAAAVQEVMAGVKIAQSFAVADDLSLFGGLDQQKRLWVQHGMIARPEIAAEQVEKILWGPVSRRVLVEGVDGKIRIYDGRDRSWTALPALLRAQWSPDEERLIYIEAEPQNGALVPRYLSLLNGKSNGRICDFGRLGDVGPMAVTDDGRSAFVLAGPAGESHVWMIALPAKL